MHPEPEFVFKIDLGYPYEKIFDYLFIALPEYVCKC